MARVIFGTKYLNIIKQISVQDRATVFSLTVELCVCLVFCLAYPEIGEEISNKPEKLTRI